VIGAEVVLVSACAGILVVPLAITPVMPDGCTAVHVIVVFAVVLVKLTAVFVVPEQIVWFGCEKTTVGAGLTVIIKVTGVPLQVPTIGVTVIVPDTGVAVTLVAVKDGISPLSPTKRPIAGLLFVHVYVVAGLAETKSIGVVTAPLHTTMLPTASIDGIGLTVITTLKGSPVHPLAKGVTT
jgi:hypothetical protein